MVYHNTCPTCVCKGRKKTAFEKKILRHSCQAYVHCNCSGLLLDDFETALSNGNCFCRLCINIILPFTVREITKSSSTFSATNISSNIVWLLQLHDTIRMKFNFGTKFSSIYLAKGEKRLVFRQSFVNLQRAKNGTHMFDAKYWYLFVV